MLRDIEKLKAQHPELEIGPVMPQAAQEEQQKALEALGVSFTYVDDAKGTAGITYRIEELPTAILVSKRSTILYSGFPDMKLQTALQTTTAADAPKRPSVIIKETPDSAPVIQPGSTPKAPGDDTVPGLREMPEF
jgi:hypothetical protein